MDHESARSGTVSIGIDVGTRSMGVACIEMD